MEHPRFKISQNAEGQFAFDLTQANGDTILRSGGYSSHAAAESVIAAVKANALIDEHYVRREASDGTFYFKLRTSNHEGIGNSETYDSASAREGGIASVKANAPIAPIAQEGTAGAAFAK
jgi:uncharacterized protein YegP (UPF0339 family)